MERPRSFSFVPAALSVSRLAILFLLATSASPVVAAESLARMTSAYLYQIARFIEVRGTSNSTFDFMVVNDAELASELSVLIKGRSISKKPIRVTHVSGETITRPDLRDVDVVFFGAGKGDVARILTWTDKGVLSAGFSDKAVPGVVLNFYLENDRLRFEVSKGAMNASGVRISSQVLKLARFIP